MCTSIIKAWKEGHHQIDNPITRIETNTFFLRSKSDKNINTTEANEGRLLVLSRLMTRTFENKLPSHLPPPSPRRTRFTHVTWFFTVAEIPRRGNPRRFCSTHLDYPRRRSIITALDYGGRVRSGFFRVGKIIPCNLFTAAKSFREGARKPGGSL